MQEQINEKTVAISVKTAKLTAEVLQKAIRKLLDAKKHKAPKIYGKRRIFITGKGGRHLMKQGALIFDKESGRYDIRFGLNDYHGGLHCGECFDVFAGGKWKPTRIEMSTGQEWYLVGIKTDVLDGLRVRVHNR